MSANNATNFWLQEISNSGKRSRTSKTTKEDSTQFSSWRVQLESAKLMMEGATMCNHLTTRTNSLSSSSTAKAIKQKDKTLIAISQLPKH